MPRAEPSPWMELQKKSAQARRGVEELGRLLDALATDDTDAITAAGTLARELEKWEEAATPLLARARESLDNLKRNRDEQVATFGQRLSRELSGRGHAVHGESSPYIVDGIVHVEEAFDLGQVQVNGEVFADCSCRSVADRVEEEIEALRRLLTPPERFLDQVLTAYQQELRAAGKEMGTQVDTTVILLRVAILRQQAAFRRNPVAKTFKDYPRDLFRADIYSVFLSSQLTIKGKRLRYAAGSDTSGAIFVFVPALGRPAHVGRIWFEPAGD